MKVDQYRATKDGIKILGKEYVSGEKIPSEVYNQIPPRNARAMFDNGWMEKVSGSNEETIQKLTNRIAELESSKRKKKQ